MRSDRKSIEYTLYDDGTNPDGKERGKAQLRRELLHVNFLNSLRNRNPGAMQVVVPAVDQEGHAVAVRPGSASNGLAERLKRNQMDGLVLLKNREPKWNAASNMYQLDFQGRATLASCKNIQLHPSVPRPHPLTLVPEQPPMSPAGAWPPHEHVGVARRATLRT